MSSDPSRLIAALARDQVNLDLKTHDLCFLAGLYLRADRAALASFEEDVLIDIFEQRCDVVDPGAERPRKRATHAIQRLRDQRMLARVDGAGIVRSGEYALTRLAAAVVEYFLAGEALTRESLTLLTGTLRAQLAEVLAAAKRADTEEAWRQRVLAPLRVTVGDLVGGIEHVDRIAAWGGARQRAWSEYYQYVHRFLRDVVRLDPERALSQRLRDQVAGWTSTPFHLLVAAAPPIRLLRPLGSSVERPPVTRRRTDREAAPDLVDPEEDASEEGDGTEDEEEDVGG